MKNIFILLTIFSFLGCGKHKESQTINDTSALQAKYETYLQLTKSQLDGYGFVDGFNENDKCDSLLWTSLYSSAGGNTDISQAEVSPGQFERNPDGSCISLSRDMILGVLTYIWNKRDLNMIERMIDYGEEHGFRMNAQAESDNAETLTPDIIATMYELRYRLGGPDSVARAFAQSLWIGGQTDYLANLQVIHILLRDLMIGSATNNEITLLQQHANNNPDNAFFQAVYHKFTDGDQTDAINALMNETWFPNNALPTSDNYCTDPYLYQRSEYVNNNVNSDWQPCSKNYTHSGVDFEWATAIILEIIK